MASIPSINNLIIDEKQTVTTSNGTLVDLDEAARPKRDIGIDDIDREDQDTPDSSPNGGQPGAYPDNTPPVEKPGIPDRETVIVRRKHRMIITDFSDGFIQSCINEGAIAIVQFNDGTEREVDWSEVFNPHTPSQTVSMDVAQIAAANNQHFWDDTNGIHVMDSTKSAWQTEYAKSNHGELSNPTISKPWHNILMNSLGILLRRGVIDMASLSRNAIAFYDGVGNNAENVMALFGVDGAQIGRTTEKHLMLNADGVSVYNADGTLAPLHASNIEADHAKITELEADHAVIAELEADHVSVNDLNAVTARIGDIEADYITTENLNAQKARIDTIESSYVTTDILNAQKARIDSIEADYISTDELSATEARIHDLEADHVSTTELDAAVGRIGTIESTYVKTTYLEANYADIDLANVDNAWIENGVIKDGSISDAMINSVSANKLTAGTIDASKINVSNLNADNITAGTINGQRIGQGSLSLDKLSEDVYTEGEVNDIVSSLQTQIDGAIETWTGTVVPTLTNSPANLWKTNSVKDTHVGDVYFVVNSQSDQNGYNYRFTKSGSNYSWQLIKDSDVTNALSRLATAEGKITTFDSDISTLKTDTGTLQTKTTNLETSLGDKVSVVDFNELSSTVEGNSRAITQHTETLSNKADSSTVSTISNKVTKIEEDIDGVDTKIGNLTTTVESKADGSTVTTISNDLNTISNTVSGHTQQISSISSTQTSMQSNAIKSSVQLWFTKANATAPSKPSSHIAVNDASKANQWNIAVPTYNASYPNYFYCYEYQYLNGEYGWSDVVLDKAMTDAQKDAKGAIAYSVQLWAVGSTQNGPDSPNSYGYNNGIDIVLDSSNASIVDSSSDPYTITGVWTKDKPAYTKGKPYYFYCWEYHHVDGSVTWSDIIYDKATTEAQQNAQNALSQLTTKVNTSAFNRVVDTVSEHTREIGSLTTIIENKADGSTVQTMSSKLNTVSDTVDGHVQQISSISSTQTSMQSNAIKSSVQLWFTKANTTAPSKPSSHIAVNDASKANQWNIAVPTYNESYPNYFYCYEYQYLNGEYGWSGVTRDIATGETQATSRAAVSDLAEYIVSTDAILETLQDQVDGQIESWFQSVDPTLTNEPASSWTTDDLKQAHEGDLYYNIESGHSWRWLNRSGTYLWQQIPDSDAAAALAAAQNAQDTADGKRRIFIVQPNPPYDRGDLWVNGSVVKYSTTDRVSGSFISGDWVTTATDDTAANQAQNTANKNVKESIQLWFIKDNTTAPSKPSAQVTTNDASKANQWNIAVPTYNASYPNYFYCMQYKLADGTFTWSDVIYDRATTENQKNSRDALSGLSNKVNISEFNNISDTVAGHTQSIGRIETTVSNKADSSTVTTLNQSLNNLSDTVEGHTSSLSQISSTQTSMQSNAIKSSVQLWFTKANTTAPDKPSSHIAVNDASKANQWNIAVPTYNASYPNYFYCYEYKYLDNTYGWSDVVLDKAMTDTQKDAKGAIAYSVQLWAVSDSEDGPDDPDAYGSNNLLDSSNQNIVDNSSDPYGVAVVWSTEIPLYSPSKPYYFYCWEYHHVDGSVTWSDIIYDKATTEAQKSAKEANLTISVLENNYAEFKQTVNEFESTIGSTYTTKKELIDSIDNIQIGGRNLALNSEEEWSNLTTNKAYRECRISSGYLSRNTYYTVSFDAKCTNNSDKFYIGFSNNASTKGILANEVTVSSDYERYSFTNKSPNVDVNGIVISNAKAYGRGNEDNTDGTLYIKNIKFEIGNKATDWTPAPEDISGNFATLETRVSNAETSITQNTTDIASRAKSSDVYTKSNIDGMISKEVSDRNSAIEQSANDIALSVSQTYTTKTDFTNLQIGGRNLIVAKPYASTSTEEISGSISSSSSSSYIDVATVRITRIKGISVYTLSFEAYASAETDIRCYWYSPNTTSSSENSDGYTSTSADGTSILTIKTEWRRFWITWTQSDDANTQKSLIIGRLYKPDSDSITLHVRAAKMEAGNRATSWTPAPEDVTAYTDSQISEAKAAIEITTDGISTEVSKMTSIRQLTSTASGWTLANIKSYSAYGTETSFNVSSTTNVKVNDIVYIKGTDTTRNCNVYIKGKVTAVNSTTSVKISALGYDDAIPVNTIISTINQSAESVKIAASKVEIDGQAIFSNSAFKSAADNAYDAKGSASNALTSANNSTDSKLESYSTTSQMNSAINTAKSSANSYTDNKLTDYSTTSQMNTAINNSVSGKADKTDAVLEEQYIYIQATSGTNSISKNNTWVTSTGESVSSDTSGLTPVWTTKRPTYRSKYPVIFIAKQKKTVSGSVTCSTPTKDDTLTIIDGGHITTGTIDASKVNVTNLDASKITTGSIAIGTVNGLQASLDAKSNKQLTDTRTENNSPSWYFTNYPKQTVQEFKKSDVLGISTTSKYCVLETVVPWVDSSGGYPVQYVTVLGNRYYRVGKSNDEWNAWNQEETSSGAQSKATSAASAAESNANSATDNKLTKYSTTTQMNTAINNAVSTVSEIANAANNRHNSFRGICSTGAGTDAKTVTSTGFTLVSGVSITVYNTSSQTYAGKLTLNVNGTGAKDIYVAGVVTSESNRLLWAANSSITYVYDGTRFRVEDNPGSLYGSTCSVDESTASKTTTVYECVIYKGVSITVPMTYSNTSSIATLNVSSLGATYIYYGTTSNVPTKSNGLAWPAKAAVIFTYDGQYWRTGNQTFIDGGNILTGTISADRIAASQLTIGYSQLTGAPSIPTKVSQLSNDSSYATTTQTNNAAKSASDYITKVDNNGIRVHAVNNNTSNYSLINASGLDVYKGGNSVAKFGDTTRIGYASTEHVNITNKKFALANSNNYEYVSFVDKRDSNGRCTATVEIYTLSSISFYVLEPYLVNYSEFVSMSSIKVNGTAITNYTIENSSNNVKVNFGNYVSVDSLVSFTFVTTSERAARQYTIGSRSSTSDLLSSIALGINVKSSGFASLASGYNTVASRTASHSEGYETKANGLSSHAEGRATNAIGSYSHAEGHQTYANSLASHAEGYGTNAEGYASHAEGYGTNANGADSHAEGYNTTTSGQRSHAEGSSTTATGSCSHAEGMSTTAEGFVSHAEGYNTTASGEYSSASGYYTIADKNYMFACGAYNRTGITSALFVVGNGTSSTRRNAFIVMGGLGSTAYAYLNGTSSSNGTAVTSDERIKTLIKDLDPSEAKEFLQSITPRMYYKEESNPEGELGFYAQEVENTIYGKQLVTKDSSGVYDIKDFRIMSYEGFIAPIVSSLQGVFKEIDELKEHDKHLENEIDELKKHDKRLENEIDELKKENEELRDQNRKLEERLDRLEQLLLNN